MMYLKNQAKFERDLTRAVARKLEKKVRPVFHETIRRAARILIEGEGGYAGTPQWKGNAAANWYLLKDGEVASYQEFFTDPEHPGPASEYSAANPRPGATQMSIRRIEAKLSESSAMRFTLVNTASYIGQYSPYGDGPTFRLDNLWPIGPQRAVARLLASLKDK